MIHSHSELYIAYHDSTIQVTVMSHDMDLSRHNIMILPVQQKSGGVWWAGQDYSGVHNLPT